MYKNLICFLRSLGVSVTYSYMLVDIYRFDTLVLK